jgi:hypothetical protein
VALVDLMVEHGGLITAADLAGYTPEWTEPISTTYRGHWRVSTLTCPSPNYGVQLLQSLNMLEHFPLAEYGHNTERGLHTICEVLKRASADRVTWRNSGKAEELFLIRATPPAGLRRSAMRRPHKRRKRADSLSERQPRLAPLSSTCGSTARPRTSTDY